MYMAIALESIVVNITVKHEYMPKSHEFGTIEHFKEKKFSEIQYFRKYVHNNRMKINVTFE